VHAMRFKLNLLDKGKTSLLNGAEVWEQKITVY
jgi:hypothetical protein